MKEDPATVRAADEQQSTMGAKLVDMAVQLEHAQVFHHERNRAPDKKRASSSDNRAQNPGSQTHFLCPDFGLGETLIFGRKPSTSNPERRERRTSTARLCATGRSRRSLLIKRRQKESGRGKLRRGGGRELSKYRGECRFAIPCTKRGH